MVYQLPAILETGKALTIIISPLRALQQDQVVQLTDHGVKAAWLNSDLKRSERKATLDNLSELCMLYLAPEQLSSRDLQAALLRCNVERVVIDEAHVLPQTAPSFRKAYGKIGCFIQQFSEPPQVIACTATATAKERKTIINSLGMDNPEIFTYPLRRENLRLYIKKIAVKRQCSDKKRELEMQLFHSVEAELREWNGKGSVIIYCPTVKRVKALKEWLKGREWNVTAYTGKMKPDARPKAQKQFGRGTKQIIIATNAFGLGINKPDVGLIIHAGLPLTLNGYTQKIGRAGRDGKKARCVLFYSNEEFHRNERILKHSSSKEAVRYGLKRLYAMNELLESPKCLWSEIEKYYGQKGNGTCGHCCRCKEKSVRNKDIF